MPPRTNRKGKPIPGIPNAPEPKRHKNMTKEEKNGQPNNASSRTYSRSRTISNPNDESPHSKRQKKASTHAPSIQPSPIRDKDPPSTPEPSRPPSSLGADGEADPDFPLRKKNEQFARLDRARATPKQPSMPMIPMMPMGFPLTQLPHQRHISNSFLHTNPYPSLGTPFFTPQRQPPPGWLLNPSLARRRSHGATATTELFDLDPHRVPVNRDGHLKPSPGITQGPVREQPQIPVEPGAELEIVSIPYVESEIVPTPSTAQTLPAPPERRNYDVPKKLQSARIAMGEHNWNAYLEITEKFLDGIMTLERLQSETNKIFQVQDWRIAERIRDGVKDMIVQWRRQNSPEA
ncbi:hypothetical protein BDV96DRAFT_349784 [Lophiotrema nucula]|uniref:Uncharacterized protein n=1 Tax=Lophiotrema nucula TaxID=690887 RepID=A0A6A5ZJ77_9PLEO|nr:hypothetical protein BDV96DRAFT_349784 [Lophiotrema nucula]